MVTEVIRDPRASVTQGGPLPCPITLRPDGCPQQSSAPWSPGLTRSEEGGECATPTPSVALRLRMALAE